MATRSWIFPAPSTTDVDEVAAVRVEVMAGTVEVHRHESPHVHVALDHVSGPPVQMTLDPTQLLLAHSPSGIEGFVRRMLPSRASGRLRLRLYLPADVPVSVSGGAAEVSASDLTEDADLATTSGRISAYRCAGALSMRTRGGDVVVREHRGDVAVTSATGRCDVQGSMPLADLSTGTSDVWVVNLEPSHRITVASLSGAVNVRVRRDSQLRLKATRLGGTATVDGHNVDLGGSGPHVEGEGPDVSEVSVSMVSGGLFVRRDAEVR